MDALRAVDGDVHVCCARCSALTRYVRTLADAMQMRDWTCEVEHEAPRDPGAHATAEVAPLRRIVRLRFADSFDRLEPRDQRYVTCHELVHPLMQPLYDTVREGVLDELGGTALRVFLGAVGRDVERTVDVLARIIAPGLPLPE